MKNNQSLRVKKTLQAFFHFRRRLDSECELCLEVNSPPHVDSEISKKLFPKIMQKTLDETQAAEYCLLNFLRSFKLFQRVVDALWPAMSYIEWAVSVMRQLQVD